MTKEQPKWSKLSEQEAIQVAAQFDGDVEKVFISPTSDNLEVNKELEGLSVGKEYLNRWFESRFVDASGKPYHASLWDKIDSSLTVKPIQKRSFIATIFGAPALNRLTFYPRELAFASVVALAVFVAVVSYGTRSEERDVAQLDTYQLIPDSLDVGSYSNYNQGFAIPQNRASFRGDHIRLVADSSPLDFRSRSNAYRRTYSEVHAGAIDIDWINSDRAVSILNAGSMKTPPIIWIGQKKYKID